MIMLDRDNSSIFRPAQLDFYNINLGIYLSDVIEHIDIQIEIGIAIEIERVHQQHTIKFDPDSDFDPNEISNIFG